MEPVGRGVGYQTVPNKTNGRSPAVCAGLIPIPSACNGTHLILLKTSDVFLYLPFVITALVAGGTLNYIHYKNSTVVYYRFGSPLRQRI